MMPTRLLTVTAALMLAAGIVGATAVSASATIPRTCFNGQLVGTVIDNGSQ
jgi:hypothetical protein